MSTILLVNAYYDFRTGTPWTPYLGGGVGFAVNQLTRNLTYTANDVTDRIGRQSDHRCAVCCRGHGRCVL